MAADQVRRVSVPDEADAVFALHRHDSFGMLGAFDGTHAVAGHRVHLVDPGPGRSGPPPVPRGPASSPKASTAAGSPCPSNCRDCPLRGTARRSVPSAASRPAVGVIEFCNRWRALRLRRLELAPSRHIPRCTAFFGRPEAKGRARRLLLTLRSTRPKIRRTRDGSCPQPTVKLSHRTQKFAVTAILPLLPFAAHASGRPFPWLVAA